MVAAREVTLQELLGGSYQYTVPLYQRTYSWGRPQWQRLWEDVVTSPTAAGTTFRRPTSSARSFSPASGTTGPVASSGGSWWTGSNG